MNLCINASQCLQHPFSPCIKENIVFVRIVEEVYLVGLEDCKNHPPGRLILTKGDKPLTHLDVCKKLDLA